jgi:flagellar hook-length control protein FliK
LGHIEVDLRMRDNALEAKFTASQMIARDLLESGLGRLKDTLQQSGMDVASIRVNDGSNARNGGDSTPRQAPQGQQVQGQVRDDSNRMDETPPPRNNPISDGRLDLMV